MRWARALLVAVQRRDPDRHADSGFIQQASGHVGAPAAGGGVAVEHAARRPADRRSRHLECGRCHAKSVTDSAGDSFTECSTSPAPTDRGERVDARGVPRAAARRWSPSPQRRARTSGRRHIEVTTRSKMSSCPRRRSGRTRLAQLRASRHPPRRRCDRAARPPELGHGAVRRLYADRIDMADELVNYTHGHSRIRGHGAARRGSGGPPEHSKPGVSTGKNTSG